MIELQIPSDPISFFRSAFEANFMATAIIFFFGFILLVLYGAGKASGKRLVESNGRWAVLTAGSAFLLLLLNATALELGYYVDPETGGPSQLVPLVHFLTFVTMFSILYNFNIPPFKRWKWLISIPLAFLTSMVWNVMLFPAERLWLLIENIILASVGVVYTTFAYEKTVLGLGNYLTRLRRFFESTGKKEGKGPPQEKEGLTYFSYGLLGRRLSGVYRLFNSLRTILPLAGLKIGYKAYVSLMVFFVILSIGISYAVLTALFIAAPFIPEALGFGFVAGSPILLFLASLLLAFAIGSMTLGLGYAYPFFKVSSRRSRLDQFLPFTSSYMTVLSSAGMTPERVLRSAADKDPKFLLSDEIANVVGRIDLLGSDVLNALTTEAERSPSTSWSDLLRGFAGVVRTGGDTKKYMIGMTKHFFGKRGLMVQGFLDTLGIIAESYVLMVIAFPLMLIVMLSIMASVGGSLAGLDIFSFMYLLSFGLLPVVGIMFLFMLDAMQPKG